MARIRRKFVDIFKSQGPVIPEGAIKHSEALYAIKQQSLRLQSDEPASALATTS